MAGHPTLSFRYVIIIKTCTFEEGLRIGIASHIVIDTIELTDGARTQSVGGPPCYSGLTARRFDFDVHLLTRIGSDFPQEELNLLSRNRIPVSEKHKLLNDPTTRFLIRLQDHSRSLRLLAKCSELMSSEVGETKVDGWLVSPVIDEVPVDVLAAIIENRGSRDFVMLDPQGYMRIVDNDGSITLRQTLELDLSGITAIKVDPQEMAALTGGLTGLKAMQVLQSKGIQYIISTERSGIHLLFKKTHVWAKMHDVMTPDSTGVGDILSAAFCCSYLKEKDPLWGLCFGVGAVKAALDTRKTGIVKIPAMSEIEENASYLYNTIGFQKLS